MKISVVLIVYRVEQYLRQCLDSVLSQSYRNLEIILVIGRSPDGNDDGCEAIAGEYAARDERIRIITCEAAGVADARNRGLLAATGELLGFVDPDDYIEPDMFEHLVSLMGETGADISVCGVYHEFVNATKTDYDPMNASYILMTGEQALENVLRGRYFYLHCWDKLYKRELWDGIVFPVGAKVEDRVVVDKILGRAASLVYSPVPKYHYRERRGSMSKETDFVKNNSLANEELAEYVKAYHPSLSGVLSEYMTYEYITSIQNIYLSGGKKADTEGYVRKLSQMKSVGGRSLRLKRFLALHFPQVLVLNTRLHNKKREPEETRFT